MEFESMRATNNGLAVHNLNRSVTSSIFWKKKARAIVIALMERYILKASNWGVECVHWKNLSFDKNIPLCVLMTRTHSPYSHLFDLEYIFTVLILLGSFV